MRLVLECSRPSIERCSGHSEIAGNLRSGVAAFNQADGGLSPGPRQEWRTSLQDDPGEAPAGYGFHGTTWHQSQRPLHRTRDHTPDPLPARVVQRGASSGRGKADQRLDVLQSTVVFQVVGAAADSYGRPFCPLA